MERWAMYSYFKVTGKMNRLMVQQRWRPDTFTFGASIGDYA
jgi:hypothetical protein